MPRAIWILLGLLAGIAVVLLIVEPLDRREPFKAPGGAGMAPIATIQANCQLGDRLHRAGQDDQARTAYLDALKAQPTTSAAATTTSQTATTTPTTTGPTTTAATTTSTTQPTTTATATTATTTRPTTAPARAGQGATTTTDPYACAYRGLEATAPEEIGPAVLDRLDALFQGLTGYVLGAAGQVLLLLLLALAWRILYLRAQRSDPGTVEVADFGGAPQGAVPTAAELAALMRQHLADANVPPPSAAPGASPEEQLANVFKAVPLADRTALGKVAAFLIGIVTPRHGHQVTGTYRSRTGVNPYGLTYQVVENPPIRRRWRKPLSPVKTVWASSYEEAGAKAAYAIAADLLTKVEAPPRMAYAQWTQLNGQGLRLYQQARALHRDRQLERAAAVYRQALQCEPGNGLVRIGLASVLEEQNQFMEAVQLYLEAVNRWPDWPEAHYRLAADLSFFSNWCDEWEKDDRRRAAIMRLLDPKPPPTASHVELKQHFLKLAIGHYHKILQLLGADRPLPWAGLRRRQEQLPVDGVKMARLCAELQLAGDDRVHGLEAEVKTLLEESGPKRWWVHYNAACFYAQLLKRSQPAATRARATSRALGELEHAFSEPDASSLVEERWIYQDPDLEPLRREVAFLDWAEGFWHTRPDTEDKRRADRESAPYLQAWSGIGQAAALLAETWRARTAQPTGPSGDPVELSRWYGSEARAWATLAAWSEQPAEQARRVAFVQAVRAVAPTAPEDLGTIGSDVGGADMEKLQRRLDELARWAAATADAWQRLQARERRASLTPRRWPWPSRWAARRATAAAAAWQALAYWAANPGDKIARRDVKRRTARRCAAR
jgi:tetratricopeptide (TPR) repeat protein